MHVYKFTLLNRRLRDGAEEDVPEQYRMREMAFRTLTGDGGVAILSKEPPPDIRRDAGGAPSLSKAKNRNRE